MTLPSTEQSPEGAAIQTAIQEKRFDEAIQLGEEWTSQDKANFEAWQLLGVAYAQAGRSESSIDAFKNAVQLRPDLPRAHFNVAQAQFAAGDKEGARASLEKCLVVDPSYRRASDLLQRLSPSAGIPSATLPGIGAPPWEQTTPAETPPSWEPAPSIQPAGITRPFPPAPQMGERAGAPTLQSRGGLPGANRPATLRTATKAWAISAIVLGSLYAVGMLICLVVLPGKVGSLATDLQGACFINLLIAVGFIAGGAGVLCRKDWGRQVLWICPIVAIVVGLILHLLLYFGADTIVQTVIPPRAFSDPRFAPQLAAFQEKWHSQILIRGIWDTIIQLAYCIPLILHMRSRRVRDAMES